MCDTMVALGSATRDGSVIFAKNSDRQPNEPLITIRVPRQEHPAGAKVRCTYIEIDQVEETYEVVLLKPSWMWGAEMGFNEFGLNIGNEAVFTKEKYGPEKLLGMDMLRLALQRCRTSEEALNLLIELLQRYGQGGDCGYEKKFTYHNSFLIADKSSAWVLETAGEYWAAEQVLDVRSISNRLSIGRDYHRCHPDLISHAVEKGWCKGEDDFHFARCYSEPLFTKFSGSQQRMGASACILEREKDRRITTTTMKRILRSHEERIEGKQFTKHSLSSVCMHGGFLFGDHTTGSYIAELREDLCTYLITGSSTPCISLFKPYWMVEGENFSFSEEQEESAVAFWRKREMLHRSILENKIQLQEFLKERDRLEEKFAKITATAISGKPDEKILKDIMDQALQEEEELLERTLQEAGAVKGKIKGSPYFRSYWKKQNKNLHQARRKK